MNQKDDGDTFFKELDNEKIEEILLNSSSSVFLSVSSNP